MRAGVDIAVRMVGITKRFPGVIANDNVDFELKWGEVHALLGENGAGKTTLMNILFGLYRPDSGKIFIGGREVRIRSPKDAIELGIGMVHQHFKLVPRHTVAENIAVALRGRGFLLNLKRVERLVEELSGRYGLRVDPRARVADLSVGERQRVEILRLLAVDARILILDEPTSVLTPQECKDLFAALRKFAAEGRAVVFITHKLKEVKEVADRVTVMRRGRVVGTVEAASVTIEELAKMMVGRDVLFEFERRPVPKGKVVIKVVDLHACDDLGAERLKGVSFEVREGEIFGVAGVAGNGQKELAEVLSGLRKPTRGKVFINGVDVTGKSPREVMEAGLAYVPEDRIGVGLAPNLSVKENLILRRYRYEPFSKGLVVDWGAVRDEAEKLVRAFSIMTSGLDIPAKTLSGGNIQRLILARELSVKPKAILAVQPTFGLDVAATEYVRSLLLKYREEGSAIVLISEDLDEVLMLSDTVAVMYNGQFIGVMPTEEADVERVGLLMGGVRV